MIEKRASDFALDPNIKTGSVKLIIGKAPKELVQHH